MKKNNTKRSVYPGIYCFIYECHAVSSFHIVGYFVLAFLRLFDLSGFPLSDFLLSGVSLSGVPFASVSFGILFLLLPEDGKFGVVGNAGVQVLDTGWIE